MPPCAPYWGVGELFDEGSKSGLVCSLFPRPPPPHEFSSSSHLLPRILTAPLEGFPAIRSHFGNVRRRKRRTLGQCQFAPLQQSRVSPRHPGIAQRGAAALFKEQLIFLASRAVCAGSVTQTCHGREQNSPQISTSGRVSFTTNPLQPARSLCQSHKDAEPQRPAAVKSSFFFDTCPSVRRSRERIPSVLPQRERPLAQSRSGAALQGPEPRPPPRSGPGRRRGLPVPPGSTEPLCPPPVPAQPCQGPLEACPAPREKAVLKWQAEHGKSNSQSYPPL